MTTEDTKKRKHVSKGSHPIHYFEDSESDNDKNGDLSDDGSSSGDSIASAPPRSKRQRTSQIVTRSSTQTLVPGTGAGGASDSTSPVPAVTAIPDAVTDTPHPISRINSLAVATPTSSLDIVPTETEVIRNTGAEDSTATSPEDPTVSDTQVPTPTEASSTPDSTLHLSPVSLNIIDEVNIPTFLLHHGKGKREVNIFGYLKQVKDPRFQRVLFFYLNFEINDKSGTSGSLPTAKRPAEITQWSSRARPATLPDYGKGKRTFADFVDSVFTWWAFIQPSWRTFERGKVSREVQGEWGDLHSPRINGLLNVVMLVYWWVRILEEQKPKDSVRADYEFFAKDVAWVFSKLSS